MPTEAVVLGVIVFTPFVLFIISEMLDVAHWIHAWRKSDLLARMWWI